MEYTELPDYQILKKAEYVMCLVYKTRENHLNHPEEMRLDYLNKAHRILIHTYKSLKRFNREIRGKDIPLKFSLSLIYLLRAAEREKDLIESEIRIRNLVKSKI